MFSPSAVVLKYSYLPLDKSMVSIPFCVKEKTCSHVLKYSNLVGRSSEPDSYPELLPLYGFNSVLYHFNINDNLI